MRRLQRVSTTLFRNLSLNPLLPRSRTALSGGALVATMTKAGITKLPLEIVLHIHSFLADWDDKYRFATINEHTWSMSSKLNLLNVLEVQPNKPLNTLQVVCAREVKLPQEHLRSALLDALVRYSYAARIFYVPYTSSENKRFAKLLLGLIDKRHDALNIRICVHFVHAKMWITTANQRGYKVKVTAYDIANDTSIDLDAFVTPEEAENTKRMIKELAIRAGRCPLRSDRQSQCISTYSNQNVSRMVPFSVVHLLEKNIEYELDTSKAIDDERMSPTATIDLSNAHSLATDIGRRYVESLVLFGSFWFLITSVDIFLHGTPSIDDCAHNAGWNYENSVQASIVSKSNCGHSKYLELSLSLGNVELLAVAGFYGHNNHATTSAFLGSSLKDLPEQLNGSQSTTQILVRKRPATSTASNRHVRQYAKISASSSWSRHSFRFAAKGFYPVNPLAFGDHPVTRNGLGGSTSQLASSVLKCIAEQKVTSEEIAIMITKTLTDSKIKAMMKDAEVVTFAKIFVKMSEENHRVTKYMKAVVGVAKLLEEKLKDHEKGTASIQQLADFSSHVLEIFRCGFMDRIADANMAGVKAYTKKHCYDIDI